MSKIIYQVVIKTDIADLPKEHELSAAYIIAQHFRTNVTFLRPENKKTPDIDVNGVLWEIKSPRGNSKKTIENNLRTARKQSKNIILDLSRSKIYKSQAIARVNFYIRTEAHNIKKLKIITKSQKIIDIL